MPAEKPVHVPRGQYPEPSYPPVLTSLGGEYRDEEEVHLLDYWRVILARRWTVLAILFTVVGTTILYTFKQVPIYQATASVQIDRENPNILPIKDLYQIETSTDDTLRTQFEVLKSRSLARRVIEDLKLDKNEEFVPLKIGPLGSFFDSLHSFFVPKPLRDSEEPDQLRSVIDEYIERLGVSPVRQARLVKVSFKSKDPELAARVVNAHGKHFIEQNLQYKVEATQAAADFLEKNLVTLKATLEKAEERLQVYSRENQILFTEDGKNTATETLRRVSEEYTQAQANRILRESYSRLVENGNTNNLPQFVGNSLINELTARLSDLERQESELAVTFRPEYPQRQRIASQIAQVGSALASEKARIVATIQSEYAAAEEREDLLAAELEKQRTAVEKVNQDIIQYNIYKGEADSIKKLHDGLVTRLKEAGVSAGLSASNIRIVDRAEVPPYPISPRKTLNILLSIAVSLIVGVGLALFQEYLDNSIKAPEDVTRHLQLATLGMIPRLGSLIGRNGYERYGYSNAYASVSGNTSGVQAERTKSVDLVVHEAPSSLMAEAYRSVRTSLLLSSPGHPPRTIVVTSAAPSEGKTTTAVNLAISLTQAGSKVVLIDADMRKPRISGILSLNAEVGLSAFLAGTAKLRDVIYSTSIPNLLFIPCGVVPPNPAELILSKGFCQMMEVLREYFDYIVLDTPPLGNVSDARILASTADSTLLVVRAFSTPRHYAQEAIAHLSNAQARVGGVVLNDVDVRRRSYYSGYSYYDTYYSGYAHGYGVRKH